MYNFYPIFHCGLDTKAANVTANLCTKQGNSSKKSAVYNQEQVIMARIGYVVNPKIVTSHNKAFANRNYRHFTQQCIVNSIAAFFKPQGPYLVVTI